MSSQAQSRAALALDEIGALLKRNGCDCHYYRCLACKIDAVLTAAKAPTEDASADSGRLINAKATAGARFVEAREVAAMARGVVERERTRVRLLQAEADYEAAARELAAAERR